MLRSAPHLRRGALLIRGRGHEYNAFFDRNFREE
jgi:hypothetical protein